MAPYFHPTGRVAELELPSSSSSNIRYDLRQRATVPELLHSSSTESSDLFGPGSPQSVEKNERSPIVLRKQPPARCRSEDGGSRRGSASVRGGHGKEESGETDKSLYYRDYFASGAHRKDLKRTPWISKPVKGSEEIWIEAEQEAVEWLSLFYDLVVVAVLTIFSTQHELSNPAAIPIFLSFFVIIFWLWVSQTAYDMRYQGNDALNRFFKFLQIGLFIYQGAAGGNWNPGRIDRITDDDPYGARSSQHEDALQSFTTVVVAFTVSRAIMALQYSICWFQARKSGRLTAHIGMNVAALVASGILAVISFCIPATSQAWKVAKLVLFYSAIGVEVGNVFVAVLLKVNIPVETHKVAERYGAFTLIILGEGIISITRSFSRAISGLSDDDSGTYIQVFLTILTLFLLYSFLFGTFDKNDHTGHARATIWQLVHFPLCFGILLLVAAMVNVVVTLSATHGITLILSILEPYSEAITGDAPPILDPGHLKYASKYMNKLSLEPPFAQTITSIFVQLNQSAPSLDPAVVYVQYAAQIAYSAFQLYGAEIPIEATNMYYTLYALNTTWTPDAAERLHARDEAVHMFNEIVQEILNDSFTGVLWLLPVAGCVLILTACRSMLWYRFVGPAHWVHHGSQLIAGVILGLLGLLDIGPKHLDIAQLGEDDVGTERSLKPLYQVLFHEIPLVIIAMVYLVVYVGSGAAIWFLQRRQDKQERSRDKGKRARGEMDEKRPDGDDGERGLAVELDSEAYPLEQVR